MLNYFRNDGILNCLSTARRVQLSMHPQRAAVLQQLTAEVCQLLDDTESFVEGFGQFLRLAEGINHDDGVSQGSMQADLTLKPLNQKLNEIAAKVDGYLYDVTEHLQPGQELPSLGGNFKKWLKDCQHLRASLQGVVMQTNVKLFESIHDIIALVHKKFISQLTSAVLGSGCGTIEKITNDLTIINFIEEGKSGLLNNNCLNALAQLNCNVTCVKMTGAVVANLMLNCHVGIIEMLEQAEGGKERLLRIKFADRIYVSGSQMRFWFFMRLLRASGFDKHSAGIKIELDEISKQLTVECSRIETIELMQSDFFITVKLLSSIGHLNLQTPIIFLENKTLTFSQLEKLIKQELITKARDDFAFKHLLLLWAFKNKSSMCYTDFIDEQYRPFTLFYPDNDSLSLVEQLVDDQQRELSLHLLAIDAVRFKPLFNKYIDAQWDRELIINLMNLDGTLLEHLPPWCKEDKEIVSCAVRQSSTALKLAHNSLQNNLEVILNAFTKNDMQPNTLLEHLPPWCKKNKEIVMRAVRQSGPSIKLADKFLQNDLDVALTAFQNNHSIIEDLSPEMKGNKAFMLKAVKSPPYEWYLKYASKELQNDIDIVLNAVRSNPGNIAYANPQLLKDETIRKAAFLTAAELFSESHNKNFREWFQWLDRLYNDDGRLVDKKQIINVLSQYNCPPDEWGDGQYGSLFKFLPPQCKQDRDIVLCAINKSSNNNALQFAHPDLQDDLEVVSAACRLNHPSDIKYASKRLKDHRPLMWDVVKRHGKSLREASPRLQNDREVVLAAVQNGGAVILHANPLLLQDEEVVLTALGHWDDCLDFAWRLLDRFNNETGQSISRSVIKQFRC